MKYLASSGAVLLLLASTASATVHSPVSPPTSPRSLSLADLQALPHAHRSILAARSLGRGRRPRLSKSLLEARHRHLAEAVGGRLSKRRREEDAEGEHDRRQMLTQDPDEDIPSDGDPQMNGGNGVGGAKPASSQPANAVMNTLGSSGTAASGVMSIVGARVDHATTSVPVVPSNAPMSNTRPAVSSSAAPSLPTPSSPSSVQDSMISSAIMPSSTLLSGASSSQQATTTSTDIDDTSDVTSLPKSTGTPHRSAAVSNSDDDGDDDDGDPSSSFTSVWQYYQKGNKFFPVAVLVTVIIALSALVAIVALMQCIARSSRYSKKKGLELPKDLDAWSDGGRKTPSIVSAAVSRRQSYISERRMSENDGDISRQNVVVIGRSGTISSHNRRPPPPSQRTSVISSSNSASHYSKEDFLPHSYDPEPEAYPVLLHHQPQQQQQQQQRDYWEEQQQPQTRPPSSYFSNTPQTSVSRSYSRYRYQSRDQQHHQRQPSRRSTPAPMVYPYPDVLPVLQQPEMVAYSRSPTPHLMNTHPAQQQQYPGPPPRLPSLPQLPTFDIGGLGAQHPYATPMLPPHYNSSRHHALAPQSHRIRPSYSQASNLTSTTHQQASLLGPRPGRGEQQGVTKASLTEQLLMQQQQTLSPRMSVSSMPPRGGYLLQGGQLQMPYGMQERRRWERCVT